MQENKMAAMPVRKLLIHMAWPMMVSMLIQALYNMVDSVFVAQLSREGFEALSLAFPVQTLMISICVGTGVGVNALLSRRLGENRPAEANAVALSSYFVFLLCWVLFLLFGLWGSRPFMTLFTQSPQVLTYGTQYLSIVTALSIGVCFQFSGERVLQATGDAVGPMVIQGIGAVVNLILDPLLIFGIGPFPRLEVAGAALATVIGQIIGMVVGILLVRRNKVLTLNLRGFRPDWTVIRDIYRIGLPAILMQALATVMSMGMNKILGLYTESGVFILGTYFKLQSFIFMPIYGLNNGMVPVVSFNYGARQRERVTGLIRFSLLISVSIMALGTVLLFLFPAPLLRLFDADAALVAAGVPALRMVCLSFVCAGISVILCSAFQSLGASGLSLIVSLLRQVVVLLPVALLLGFLAPQLIWLAFLAAELISCILALLLYRRLSRNTIARLV